MANVLGLLPLARWRRGNAGVCKTSMQGFDSPPCLMDKEKEREPRDESGYSEKENALDIEVRAGEWQNLKKFNTYKKRSRQGKIIVTYQAVSNRLRQLEKLFYELCRDHPKKAEKLLWQIKKLRLMQDVLLQCLVWEPKGQLKKEMVPIEVWELIK